MAFFVDAEFEMWIAGCGDGCVCRCERVLVVRNCVVARPGVVVLMQCDVCGVCVLAGVKQGGFLSVALALPLFVWVMEACSTVRRWVWMSSGLCPRWWLVVRLGDVGWWVCDVV